MLNTGELILLLALMREMLAEGDTFAFSLLDADRAAFEILDAASFFEPMSALGHIHAIDRAIAGLEMDPGPVVQLRHK